MALAAFVPLCSLTDWWCKGWMAGWLVGLVEFKPNLKPKRWMNFFGLFEMNGLNGWMAIIELLIQAVGNIRNKTNLGCPIHWTLKPIQGVGLMKYDHFPLIHSSSWQFSFHIWKKYCFAKPLMPGNHGLKTPPRRRCFFPQDAFFDGLLQSKQARKTIPSI